ncbi:pLS20_p028 family conjugation system transmembrane protein [Catellicoccus marimammalium]|uniref:Membrane protein, putative, (PXO2-14) n=1 Tax=Catellicoccus marimammalium M35/04/3 TaxID=1234409 RepID=K8ZKV0_9ENTE|nr:hypothetical protein [Catellicoccus marimammalium]EKU27208.1 membrane protein, putative, (pXO2-14) [Catellicoccus marimammalium M35/04/3]
MASAEWLMNHSDWVQFASIMSWIWRTIEWAIVKGLYFLCQGAENVIDSIFKVTELLNDGVVGKYYHAAQMAAWGVLAVMLVWIGIRYVIGKEISLKNNLIQLVLGACIVVGGAGVIDWGLQVATGTFQDTKAVVSSDDSTLKSSLSFNIIKDNTADLMYIGDHNQWNTLLNNANKKEKETTKNKLSSDVFMNMDLTEVLNKEQLEEIKSKNKEASKALGLEIIGTNDNGKYETKEIKNGWFSLFDDGYFRYGARFMPMIIGLVVMLCAFLLTAFIIVTNILDLVFVKILSPIMAVSDIDTGQRLKNMAMEAFKSLIVIACSGISLGIFSRYFTWVGQQDFGVVPYTVLLLAGLKVCIDGSHVFGKLLGVDVGLHDGWKSAMGAYAGMKGVASAGKGAVSAGKAVASGVGNVAHGAGDVIRGINQKIENHTMDSIHDELSHEHNSPQGSTVSQLNHTLDSIHDNQTNMNQDGNKQDTSIEQQEGNKVSNAEGTNAYSKSGNIATGDQNIQQEEANVATHGGDVSTNTLDNEEQTSHNEEAMVAENANLENQESINEDMNNAIQETNNPTINEQENSSIEENPANEAVENQTIESIHGEDGQADGVVDNGTMNSIHDDTLSSADEELKAPDMDSISPTNNTDIPSIEENDSSIKPLETNNQNGESAISDVEVPNNPANSSLKEEKADTNVEVPTMNDSKPSTEGTSEVKSKSKDNILSEVDSYADLDLTRPVYRTREEFERANVDLTKPDPEYMKQRELKQYEDQIDEMMGINRKVEAPHE